MNNDQIRLLAQFCKPIGLRFSIKTSFFEALGFTVTLWDSGSNITTATKEDLIGAFRASAELWPERSAAQQARWFVEALVWREAFERAEATDLAQPLPLTYEVCRFTRGEPGRFWQVVELAEAAVKDHAAPACSRKDPMASIELNDVLRDLRGAKTLPKLLEHLDGLIAFAAIHKPKRGAQNPGEVLVAVMLEGLARVP